MTTKLQDFLNSPITNVSKLQRRSKPGDLFGIELECEGRKVDWDGSDEVIKHWAPHNDGSLRNNHGSCCEWVFNGPVKYKQAVERVDKLFEYFDGRKTKLVTSNRTSTHIHYNMGDKNAYQLVNLFILFTILEDILDRYCGEDRRGNLFCLSSRHAEEQVRWVQDCCFKHYSFVFREDWRYCSLNLASVNKFGTVEFRGMRGLDNKEDLLAWLSIVNEFCEYACYTMKNPVTIIEDISVKTPLGLLKNIFSPENVARLTEGLDEHEINASIYEGLRLVQMLCYRVGTEFDQVRLRGKDFWASFKDDQEPVLDIDPKALAAGVGLAPKPRRVRVGARMVDPFARPVEAQQIVEAGPDMNAIFRQAAADRNRWEPPRPVGEPIQQFRVRIIEENDDHEL